MTQGILARFPMQVFWAWLSQSSPSIPDRNPAPWRSLLLIVASIACGRIGWSGHVLTLPVAMLFPALWAMSPSRSVAACVSAGCFLAASRGLPQGVVNFYATDLWPGLLLWLGASLSFVGVHAALWKRQLERNSSNKWWSGTGKAARYLLAAVLTGLPPLGIIGWAHPLTASGVLFPGWGWWGLAAAAASIVIMTSRYWPAAAIILGGFWLWSAATWMPPPLPEGWVGVDLERGQSLGREASLEYHSELLATVRAAASSGTRVVLLPESTLGFWTSTVERLWRDGLRGSPLTVIAGAAVFDNRGYDNVLVAISASDAHIFYRERMPVPVSMWQPWRVWTGQNGGARAHLFANPIAPLAGTTAAPLICYEQLLLWPILQSMLYDPDIVLAAGNGWWTAGTSIVAIQRANAVAWAKLFKRPLVMAFNT